MLASLTPDVWVFVVRHLQLRDAGSLAQTCKALAALGLPYVYVGSGARVPWSVLLHKPGLKAHIRSLDLARTRIHNIGPLAGCTMLRELVLYGQPVGSIAPLRQCVQLTRLDLRFTRVTSISALGGCRNLVCVNLSYTNIGDIGVLSGCRSLVALNLACSEVRDISAVCNLQRLTRLNLNSSLVADIRPLGKIPNLRSLNLAGLAIQDLSVLAVCVGLTDLNVSHTRVHDISALGACTRLAKLVISGTDVTDIRVLERFPDLGCLEMCNIRGVAQGALLVRATSLTIRMDRDISMLEGIQAPRLRKLELQLFGDRGEPTDISVLSELTGLEQLRLDGLLVVEGVVPRLPNLVDLGIDSCASISTILAGVTGQFSPLRRLALVENDALPDMSLLAGLPNLTTLEIWGNNQHIQVASLATLGIVHLTLMNLCADDWHALGDMENLERLRLAVFKGDIDPPLDLRRCTRLKTLRYYMSAKHILLPPEAVCRAW